MLRERWGGEADSRGHAPQRGDQNGMHEQDRNNSGAASAPISWQFLAIAQLV